MTRKTPFLPIIIIITFAAGFIYMMKGYLSSHNTYGVVGRPAISEDGKNITALVAVSEATSYQVNGGYRRTTYNTSYWLKQYETATGKLLKSKKIVADAEKNNMVALCYGGYDGNIWVHTDGLRAYSLNNLQEVMNKEKLAANNAFNQNDFPADQRFIEEAVADGYIVFTASTGIKYRLDAGSFKITPEKETADSPEENINKQLRLLKTYNITYGVRSDTLNGKMYMLAKDSTAAINSHPDNGDDAPVYKRLHLYAANYTVKKYGRYQSYSYSNLQLLNGADYLNAVFLKDFTTNKAIHLQKPPAYIILHNDNLTNNAQSILTAIDESNQPVWQLNTGISTKLNNCTLKQNWCILYGNKQALIGPHIGSDKLCIVNMIDGKMELAPIGE